MKKKYLYLLIIAPVVFILDQITKFEVVKHYEYGSRHPVIQGFFDLVYFKNEGAAFGMLAHLSDSLRAPFFYIVATIAVVGLIFLYRSLKDNEILMPIAISLVFAGIAGNIADRIRTGSVVDFLSFHIGESSLSLRLFGKIHNIELEWPAFNIADSAITVAMFLILYSAFFLAKKQSLKK